MMPVLPTEDHTLRDGAVVRLRRLVEDDAAEILKGFGLLSAESRYRRFLDSMQTLKPADLHYLTHVDGTNHIAWVAGDADRNGLGVARSIREVGSEDTAEFAIAIIDAWQGRGLGALLTRALYEDAWKHGIRFWRATMLADNKAVQRIIAKVADEESRHAEDRGSIEVLYRLKPS